MTDLPCLACDGTGMKPAADGWRRTCRHCYGSGFADPICDLNTAHALDHGAYAEGVPKPTRLMALEAQEPFWRTLGGSETDPWGCGGETFRERAQARAMGVGARIYGPMGGMPERMNDD